jgi:HAD superfamily hydrolase (TIGR01509 family)
LSPERLSQLLQERESFLFDLDGTLVDSNACHERAYLVALRPRRPELAERFNYEPCKGRRTRDCLQDLGIADPAEIEELNAAKQQAYRDLVASGAVETIAGARELLVELRDRNRRLFVVTGGSRRSTETVLAGLGIREWFEGVVTADEVAECKPAPDCWLRCAADHSIVPARALVVEDALTGILAARAAGMDAIAVNNPLLSDLPEYAGSMEDLVSALRTGS